MMIPKKKWLRPDIEDGATPRLKFPKKTQAKKRRYNPARVVGAPEIELQSHLDSCLVKKRIPFFRISEGIWQRILELGDQSVIKWCRWMFKGACDSTINVGINKKYSLGMHIELKTRCGNLSRKQEDVAGTLPWQILRSKTEIDIAIKTYRRHVTMLRIILELYNGNIDALYEDLVCKMGKRLKKSSTLGNWAVNQMRRI